MGVFFFCPPAQPSYRQQSEAGNGLSPSPKEVLAFHPLFTIVDRRPSVPNSRLKLNELNISDSRVSAARLVLPMTALRQRPSWNPHEYCVCRGFDSRRLHHSILKNRPVDGFFFAGVTGRRESDPRLRGVAGVSPSTARRRRSDFRLQAKGSPIRLTKGNRLAISCLPPPLLAQRRIAEGDFFQTSTYRHSTSFGIALLRGRHRLASRSKHCSGWLAQRDRPLTVCNGRRANSSCLETCGS